jgi:predicted transposase YbfD/YdcC
VIEGLVESFAALDDPRCPGKVEHRLVDVLVIAVCAVVAEAETFEDIALYGRCKESWLRGFLELPGGIPSHDTFRRVLMLIDPDAFERCFLAWVREAFHSEDGPEDGGGAAGPEQIAVDGKTARHSFDRRHARSPLHLVSAYATERGLVLAQRATGDKGGEVAAVPAVLDGLHIEGCLVGLDALSCRREIAEHIVSRGADYLLTLKGNQGRVHDEVRAWFAGHAFDRSADLRPCFDAFDDTHGRLVRRRVFACPDAGCFTTLRDWPGLATVLATETIRGVDGTGVVAAEIRHYLSSSTAPPETLATAIRQHWAIENGQHWVLDMIFGEDRSRVREQNAARNLAVLRRIARDLLRADTSLKASLKGKRKTAAWDNAFMAKLLGG